MVNGITNLKPKVIMQKLYKADGTPIEIMTKDDFKYKDLMNELYSINNENVIINNFYYENGIIYIKGMLKSKTDGNVSFDFIKNSKYFPRNSVYGYVTILSSSDDFNKVNVIEVTEKGKLYYWVSRELSYGVPFTIMYPMKLS